MDILETVVFIGSLFIVVYLFILQPNQIKGASMEPTFYNGEYILTSKATYRFRRPQRGDVVVLKSPKNPDIEYIKRIVGLPGDKIMIHDGNVYLNNQLLEENYISAKTNLWEGGFIIDNTAFTVPDNEFFVMGDNRPRSSDSREFGPIPSSSIIGYVFYRYYPPGRVGAITNPLAKPLQTNK
jgi:signal peptidase I